MAREQKWKQHAQERELEISSGIWSSNGEIKNVCDKTLDKFEEYTNDHV